MLRGLLVMAMCAVLFPLAVPAQAAVATIAALTGTPAPAGLVSTLTVTVTGSCASWSVADSGSPARVATQVRSNTHQATASYPRVVTPFWISAFLDVPASHHATAAEFCSTVTGTTLSEPRGDDEFTTLVPDDGDDFLRMQRVGDGPPRLHLDLHVEQPQAAADASIARGAQEVAALLGYVVLTSPGGMTFCLVSHPAGGPPPARTRPGGQSSLVDQVCLDIAPAAYDEEQTFWEATTGFPPDPHQRHPEFRLLVGPDDQPLQLLTQRLGDGDGPTSAHLDLGTSEGGRPAEMARHERLDATGLREHKSWTVLTDPAGVAYRVADHPVR